MTCTPEGTYYIIFCGIKWLVTHHTSDRHMLLRQFPACRSRYPSGNVFQDGKVVHPKCARTVLHLIEPLVGSTGYLYIFVIHAMDQFPITYADNYSSCHSIWIASVIYLIRRGEKESDSLTSRSEAEVISQQATKESPDLPFLHGLILLYDSLVEVLMKAASLLSPLGSVWKHWEIPFGARTFAHVQHNKGSQEEWTLTSHP